MSLLSVIDNAPPLRRLQDSVYERLSNRSLMIGLTVIPVLLLLTFVLILPIIWAIRASFFEIPLFQADWNWVGAENYVATLTDAAFRSSLWRSIVFAVGSVVVQLVAGIGIALVIAREFPFNKGVRAVVLLPYLIPTALLGYLGLWMFDTNWGVLNSILIRSGLSETGVQWFGNPDTAMLALILATAWKYAIFVTILVLARLQSIPEGYYDAARVAGASRWQQFRDITLPNLKGVIFIVVLLRGVWMFNKYDIIDVMTGGGPGDATETAPIYAYDVAFGNYNLGQSAAVSVVLFAILIVAAVIYFRVLEPESEVRTE
ncbi:carbohydrate ABC transporter permease [Saliphagus sp. LR7]|uniref:carbohydrate ABC transporter permease n=1 Tax=Saliphagus sp. LR7 TaxID=2282654 RepID=UPI000DF7ADB9|nr:sugar ABC transporter permease [Saliphagus sp. LR7]